MDAWLIHGLLGSIAILLVFPLGVVKLWTKQSRWQLPHWMIQSTGVFILMFTAGLGLLKSNGLHHSHQALGLGVYAISLMQLILGHANSLKPQTAAIYIRVAHSSLGFSALLLGWITILTGFRLASVASTPFVVVGLVSATEICALIAGSIIIHWRGAQSAAKTGDKQGSSIYTVGEEYDSEDDQDSAAYENNLSSRRQSSSTLRSPAEV